MTHATRGERSAALSQGAVDTALPRNVRGAADPNFACAVRAFSQLFPGRRFGGGALSIYLDGQPVVDVWTAKSPVLA